MANAQLLERGNLYFLYTFGDDVEDRVGTIAFLGWYLLWGVLSGATLSVRDGLALVASLLGVDRPVRTLPPSIAMAVATAAEALSRVRRGSPRICAVRRRDAAIPSVLRARRGCRSHDYEQYRAHARLGSGQDAGRRAVCIDQPAGAVGALAGPTPAAVPRRALPDLLQSHLSLRP